MNKEVIYILLASSMALSSCVTKEEQEGVSPSQPVSLSSFSKTGHNFKVSLTDAPNKELAKVNVNIKSIVLKISGSGNGKELQIAENIGVVDLLTLQNGVMMEMADISMPIGVKVSQIRLILEDFGNTIEYTDGKECILQTPSAAKSGLKLISPSFEVEEGKGYSLVVDFDAKKSIVHNANEGCLLKPVLRWGGIKSVNLDNGIEEDIEDDLVEDDANVDDSISDDSVVNDGVSDDSVVNDGVSDDSVVNDGVSDDSVVDDGGSGETIICSEVSFNLFDMNDWPSDYVFEDYVHCY